VAVAGAVAGAVAAPELALAQVQIYGKFNAEYGFVSQADSPAVAAVASVAGGNGSVGTASVAAEPSTSRNNADGFNSGASYVGVKGEEKLGGAMSAWFQCETRARFGVDTNPAQAASGICDRNSALGLKGDFGNFFVGRWDTAIENISGTTRLVGSTGYQGVQHMLTEDQGQFNIQFAQRVQNSLNYNSPSFGGFTVDFSTTTQGAELNTAAGASAQTGKEGRIYSMAAKYAAGPLVAYGGYEKHNDNQALISSGLDGASENMFTFGASYVFGPVKVALVYTDVDGDKTLATEVQRKTWQLGADWKVTGPGTVRVAYTQADDFKGSAGITDSGAKQYQIQYLHALSKRTTAAIYYVGIDNDTNGVYNFHGFNSLVKPGDSPSAFVFQLVHTF
jgi:predicted porin